MSTSMNLTNPRLSLRSRPLPDVPRDVDHLLEHNDQLMAHLNDPNYDLYNLSPSSTATFVTNTNEDKEKKITPKEKFSFDDESLNGSSDPFPSPSASRASSVRFDDESPYPEVRASVSGEDEPLMPVNTFRMWFLGLFYTILIAGINQTFSMRYPSVYITGIVAQLTALPLGRALEAILPTTQYRTFGYQWTLNPGRFTIKEHVVIVVMTNVAANGVFATDVIASQRIFYKQVVPMSYQILLSLSSQIYGFALGGMLRSFVVWPASAIWPGALVNAALFNTLHKNYGKREGSHFTREKFFCVALGCSFLWYWMPGYLWTGLSMFSWICWISPNNTVVNSLFGTATGLGMSVVTFDWAMISFIGSPLVTPWWSEANAIASFILFFWIVAPIVYYTNTFFSKFMPISALTAFDSSGLPYDPLQIVSGGLFDVNKYLTYSPLYISSTLAISYGLAFASFTAVFVHTFIWYRHDIVRRFGSTLRDEQDVHSRLMQAYPEVPRLWYAAIAAIAFTFLSISIYLFPTQLPFWGLLIAVLISAALSIPLALIQAISNQQISFSVMHELIAGYILPGRPVANMIFKCVALMGTTQATLFAGDLKLGHYMKIPPRLMFAAQTVAVIVNVFVAIGVQEIMFSTIPDLCSSQQKDGFTCSSTMSFATASLIFGGIGPQRLFSPGAMYSSLMWFFLVGALSPIPFYLLSRRYPLSFWRFINMPVFFAGSAAMPPASGINYSSWAIVGFIFNFCIRRYHFRWWMRYNYILSAALDAGVAIAAVVIFFAIQMRGVELTWWGNTVWLNTADARGEPAIKLVPGQRFGPSTWF